MDTTRPCGCKGRRTCLLCEEIYDLKPSSHFFEKREELGAVFCPWCNKAFTGWHLDEFMKHPKHFDKSFDFPGVCIVLNFINEEEETKLLSCINNDQWDSSQSGRQKQNFGPKCNFKKKKIKMGNFKGFPTYSKFVQDRFADVEILKNYETVEQCALEYTSIRGASIDPHIDDCWVWGERIVTLSLLSDSVLTLTRYQPSDLKKYNLNDILDDLPCSDCKNNGNLNIDDIVVRVPMPKRSLLVLYGKARYEWEHCILREDIKDCRICLTYREFSPLYQTGELYETIGKDILKQAKIFF